MSDLTVMEAMVARELWNTADDYGNPEDYVEQARALIHSLRPIIEAEVRERIAADIEAAGGPKRDPRSLYDEPARHQETRWAAYRDAARIARGKS